MDENKILCADNLVIGNDGRALTKKMNFRIGVGECILLCGANGIGKSTLLRTLAGIIPAVSGEIGLRGRMDGVSEKRRKGCSRGEAGGKSEARQTDGFVETEEETTGDRQDGRRTSDTLHQADGHAETEEETTGDRRDGRSKGEALRVILVPARIPKVPGFSVMDFVATSCYRESDWLGRLPAKIRGQISETLEALGIGHLAGRDISSLSDGEFQKAAIATALLQQAEVVLLDEPTAFLDVDSRESALYTLREVARRKHVSIIFSSHDIHTAAKYCTRVFGMKVGDYSDLDIDPGNGRPSAELRYGRQMDKTRQHRWNGRSSAELKSSAEHRFLAELIDTGPGCTREQQYEVFSRCFRLF